MKLETKGNVYRFLYKRDKPKAFKVAGFIVLAFSILAFFESPLVAGLLAVIGSSLLIWQSGIEVNVAEKSYRLINSLGPLSWGDWDTIPPLKCVAVFKTNLVSNTYSRTGMAVTNRESVIQVNLATASNQRIRLYDASDAEDAFELAEDIAKEFNLKIWDATTADQKWLKKKGKR